MIKAILEIWYIPIIVAGALGVMGLLMLPSTSELVFYASLGFPFIALVISGIIGVYRLFKKEYLKGILQIGITMILSFLGLSILSFVMSYYPYDYYSDHLEIPLNIKLEKPLNADSKEEKNATIHLETKNHTFILFNSSQPGMYTYHVWLKPKEKGFIYLKAYEITKNDRLSESRLMRASKIEIDSLELKLHSNEFTIYEGDWGKPYSARIELWFVPKEGAQEYMLLSKNYLIEGWMR
ncbi:MAG: hypothetical protein ACKVTZ_10685 [Bacteroidia bacterium]